MNNNENQFGGNVPQTPPMQNDPNVNPQFFPGDSADAPFIPPQPQQPYPHAQPQPDYNTQLPFSQPSVQPNMQPNIPYGYGPQGLQTGIPPYQQPMPPQKSSSGKKWLIGCGIALVLAILLGLGSCAALIALGTADASLNETGSKTDSKLVEEANKLPGLDGEKKNSDGVFAGDLDTAARDLVKSADGSTADFEKGFDKRKVADNLRNRLFKIIKSDPRWSSAVSGMSEAETDSILNDSLSSSLLVDGYISDAKLYWTGATAVDVSSYVEGPFNISYITTTNGAGIASFDVTFEEVNDKWVVVDMESYIFDEQFLSGFFSALSE